MRPKSIILLVLALGCGLVASIGINQVLANRGQPITITGEMTPIYVSLADINQGVQLTPEMIKLQDWPKNQVPPGAITKLDDVVGRVTKSRFVVNEPILDGKLFAKGDKGEGATPLIPMGMRVVSVRVDTQSGISGLILPGDSVDVLLHVAENIARGIPRTLTKTILQNVTVFAVDNIYDRGSNGETTIAARTVSLLVTPEQAEMITQANAIGTVQLVLRGTNDDEVVDTAGQDVGSLFSKSLGQQTPEPKPAQVPVDNSGILAHLNAMREQQAKRPPKTGWKMIVFDGDEYREVEVQDESLGRGRLVPHLDTATEPAPMPSEPDSGPLTIPGILDGGSDGPDSNSRIREE